MLWITMFLISKIYLLVLWSGNFFGNCYDHIMSLNVSSCCSFYAFFLFSPIRIGWGWGCGSKIHWACVFNLPIKIIFLGEGCLCGVPSWLMHCSRAVAVLHWFVFLDPSKSLNHKYLNKGTFLDCSFPIYLMWCPKW